MDIPLNRTAYISNYTSNWYLSTDGQSETPNQAVQIWNHDPMVNGGKGSRWRISRLTTGPAGEAYRIDLVDSDGKSTVCLSARKSKDDSDESNSPANQGGQGIVTVQTIAADDSYQAWRIVPVRADQPLFEISPVRFPEYTLGGQNGSAAHDTLVRMTRKWASGTVAAVQTWIIEADREAGGRPSFG
ncbi:hypothetical protein ACFYOT_33395 [Saccharothrix saharensis]|uniref:hypothetical protein n=1 Tax=Saccharothrix saharensis TaxID=571190 RepID=UPI0036B02B3D